VSEGYFHRYVLIGVKNEIHGTDVRLELFMARSMQYKAIDFGYDDAGIKVSCLSYLEGTHRTNAEISPHWLSVAFCGLISSSLLGAQFVFALCRRRIAHSMLHFSWKYYSFVTGTGTGAGTGTGTGTDMICFDFEGTCWEEAREAECIQCWEPPSYLRFSAPYRQS
jgi:hypothetical protein